MRRLYCFLGLLTWTGCVFAQTARISGTVLNSRYQPVPDVQVMIPSLNLGVATNSSGVFVFKQLNPGQYALTLDHIAYKNLKMDPIQIHPNEDLVLKPIILDDAVLPLEGVVVTATRTDRLASEVSQAVNVVDQSVLSFRQSNTPAEALREEPGLFVQKTGHGGGSVNVRGLSSSQILILVDGVRLNNSTYRLGNHPYLTWIDPAVIRQIEVIRGPTSMLYGSDAMGGTIHVLSRMPSMNSPSFQINGKLFSRYASADRSATGRLEAALSNRKLAVQAGISLFSAGDLRRGANSHYPELEVSDGGVVQSPTGFKANYFNTKMVLQMTTNQSLTIAYQNARRRHVPRYDKYENNGYLLWEYHPQYHDLIYMTYRCSNPGSVFTSVAATISYQRQLEGRRMQKEASLRTDEEDQVGTMGISLQLNSLYRNHILTYGAEGYFDAVQSHRWSGQPSEDLQPEERGRYPDGARYNSSGLFIQDEWCLSPVWRITAGLRISLFYADFNMFEGISGIREKYTQYFRSLTGHAGIIWKLSNQLSLNMNAGQAFRAPNLSDLSKLGESKGDIWEVPNSRLEAEKMLSFDTGLRFSSEQLKWQASLYYSVVSDLIASADALFQGLSTVTCQDVVYQVKSKQNIGQAYITGAELSVSGHIFSAIKLYGNLTCAYGQNRTLREPVGGIPPLFGLAGMGWESRNLSVSFYARFAGNQNRLSQDDLDDPRIPERGTPGWYTLNFRLLYQWKDFVKIQLAFENILDYNYREHGSGVNSPGRNLVASVYLEK